MSVHKKFQPIRSSRLAGYRQHIYTNVLFYYIDIYATSDLQTPSLGYFFDLLKSVRQVWKVRKKNLLL